MRKMSMIIIGERTIIVSENLEQEKTFTEKKEIVEQTLTLLRAKRKMEWNGMKKEHNRKQRTTPSSNMNGNEALQDNRIRAEEEKDEN